jgi:hypothetical protein
MNDGIEAFRLRLQKELGLLIGPKDPLLAQKELLEQNAAEHQRLGLARGLRESDPLDRQGEEHDRIVVWFLGPVALGV